MKKTKFVCGVMFGALATLTGSASAAITSPTVVDFGYKPSRTTPDTVLTLGAYYAKGNLTPNSNGTCPGEVAGSIECIYQNGMVVSTIDDPTGPAAHLHQGGSTVDREVAYHNDSGGVYIRALDSTAFSLDSIELNSPLSGENPYAIGPDHTPAQDFYEILGFSDAVNPGLANGDGTNYANRVAYQTFENGLSGTVTLNDNFRNVSSVWIHYFGVPNVASAAFPFKVQVDNIAVSAAQVSNVPVPTAVWMFGTGLIGMLSFGRKRISA